MKETFFTLIFAAGLLIACSGRASNNSGRNADNSADSSMAVIAFNELEHNFGQVKAGRKVRHTFNFENKGTEPLVIQSVRTTCGCTAPRYDRRPIAPGRRGRIEVEFDTSGRNGIQTQSVTINSNATVPVVVLRITADVTQ